MNAESLIPITLFICIVYAIRVVVEARVRQRIISANGSQELVRSILESEELRRKHESLRRGIVLVALAIGFALLDRSGGFDEFTPMSAAILLGATGLGNLAYYLFARKAG